MKKSFIMFATMFTVTGLMGVAQAADAAKGEKVFRRCKVCHKVEEGKNGIGPSLFGVVGRTVATEEGFSYSKAMTDFGADGKVWDHDHLDKFLAKPSDLVPGTKMSFPGLKKEDQRADLIAYLESLK